MEKLWSMWEVLLIPGIVRFYENKYLAAVRQSFYVLIPFWLTVSFFDFVGNVLLNPNGILLGKDGLNFGFVLTGGLSGEEYLSGKFAETLKTYREIISTGYGVTAMILTATLAGKLSKIWDCDKHLTIFCALFSYLFISPISLYQRNDFTDYFSETGFFSAFFATFISAKIFSLLFNQKKLKINVPKFCPKYFSRYLSGFIPVLLTLFIFSLISFVFKLIQVVGENFFAGVFDSSIFQSPFFVPVYQFFVWLCWWLGIPGYDITAAIQENVYLAAQVTNQTGETAAIFTTGFFEAGVIHVMGLLIAIIVFSQHESWRSVAKFSFPFMAFNVQEVFIFGLPVVLNPIFLLPYIFAPIANVVVGYIAISWGIVPIFQTEVPWTMPLFLSAAVGTHSIMGAVLQAVWLITDIFIYAPFVITANALELDNEKDGGEKNE